MPIPLGYADRILKYYFNGVTDTLPTDYYASLHTADPGASGSQSTNEISYLGYARENIAITSGMWAVGVGPTGIWKATLLNNVVWPTPADPFGLPVFITHLGLGDAPSGTGFLRWRMLLTAPITLDFGQRPRLLAGTEFYICDCGDG